MTDPTTLAKASYFAGLWFTTYRATVGGVTYMLQLTAPALNPLRRRCTSSDGGRHGGGRRGPVHHTRPDTAERHARQMRGGS